MTDKTCVMCHQKKEVKWIRERWICLECIEKIESDEREPDIEIQDTFDFFASNKGSYVFGKDKPRIELGILCDENWVLLVLLHEYHHHIIKRVAGMVATKMWDNISRSGLIEQEILDYDS